jgi:hypothetical protein
MRRGDFAAAWEHSDRILGRRAGPYDWTVPRHRQPIWNGAPLEDRRVLVRCYHGLGDTIQFIRYAPLLRRVARRVIVWAQPALLPILNTVSGIDVLLPLHDGVPEVDYDIDIEVMELPYAFRTTLDTVPSAVPYLAAQPASLPGARPRVAIFWRAGDWNARRTIPFHLVEALLRMKRITWFTSVTVDCPEERSPRLECAAPNDIWSTAQLLCACDLVISADSMPAHLAGALARPVWTLLPCHADWRWMQERNETPWYPTMRLFRQSQPGDWRTVIERVQSTLANEVLIGDSSA